MLNKLFLSALLVLSVKSLASLPENFGTGPSTTSIGNQSNMDADDPSNLYFNPALLGFSKTIGISASSVLIKRDFENINNIVTENSSNSTNSSPTYGSADMNYQSIYSGMFNFILPIKFENSGALGISYFSPLGKVLESDSGDPALPEYVMHRARYRRSQIYLNYGLPLFDNWAISLGAHVGFQASARVKTRVSLSNNYGSNAASQTKVTPSLGAIIGVAKKEIDWMAYFTFQQEMKQNLETLATGDISDPPLTLINLGIDSVMYYDPHIFRFGYSHIISDFTFFSTVEYQLWENFKTPALVVSNKGGTVKGSSNYDSIKMRNILVPKIGVKYNPIDNWNFMGGISYRQTPFDHSLDQSGNSIDTNSLNISGGLTFDFKMFKRDLQIGFSALYSKLEEKTVSKSSGQENGNTGLKIGAPGYKVGGSVMATQGGIKVNF